MTVMDIARESVVSLPTTTSVSDVARTMQDQSVTTVIIVEEDKPIGIVSDRDLAFIMLSGEIDPETTTVEEAVDLNGGLVTMPSDAGIYDLVERMSETGTRRVPITEDGDLVGIVSLSDVIVLLGMELQHVANTLRTVAPAYEKPATELYDH